MDSSDADQRAPHQLVPNQPVTPEHLVKLGVLSWALDMSVPVEENAQLAAIRKERNYSYMDIITISPEKLENYEGKLKIFFKEHLHTDEEIRLILVRGPPRAARLLRSALFAPTHLPQHTLTLHAHAHLSVHRG
jgi:1,2-dihydroxy-3-keto-5-methylthiopentene dioxygenase